MPIKVKKYERQVNPAGGQTGVRKQVGYDPVARVLDQFSGEMKQQANAWNRLAAEKRQAKEAAEFAAGQAKYLELIREKQDEFLKRDDYGSWMEEAEKYHGEILDGVAGTLSEQGAKDALYKYGLVKGQVFLGDVQGMANQREAQGILEDVQYAVQSAIVAGDRSRAEAIINSQSDWVLPSDKKGKMITDMNHDMDYAAAQRQVFDNYNEELVREDYKYLSDDEFITLEKQRRREQEYQEHKAKTELAEYQTGNYFKALDGMIGENGAPMSQNTIDQMRDNGEISNEHWYSITQINRGLLNAGSTKIAPEVRDGALQEAYRRLSLPVDHPDHWDTPDIARLIEEKKILSSDTTKGGVLYSLMLDQKDFESNRFNIYGKEARVMVNDFLNEFDIRADFPGEAPLLMEAFENQLDIAYNQEGKFERQVPMELARESIREFASSHGILEKNWVGWKSGYGTFSERMDTVVQNLTAIQAAFERHAIEAAGGKVIEEADIDDTDAQKKELAGDFSK